MKRVLWSAVLLAISCKGSSAPAYAGTAVTAAAGVAMAGAYRAITGGCWATCPPGSECDEASGTCTKIPCSNQCPADSKCVRVGAAEECVRRTGERGSAEPKQDDGAQGKPHGEPDPCRGLCFSGEECTVDAGVADCVPVSPRPPK